MGNDDRQQFHNVETYIAIALARVRQANGTTAEEQVAVENAVKNFYRDSAVERRRERRTEELPADNDLTCPKPTPFAITAGRDLLQQTLERLAAHERRALLLAAQEQLTYEDIAVEMSLPVETVRTILRRARSRLRMYRDGNGEHE